LVDGDTCHDWFPNLVFLVPKAVNELLARGLAHG